MCQLALFKVEILAESKKNRYPCSSMGKNNNWSA